MLAQLRLMGFWDIVRTVLDISIVAYVLYRLLLLIRGTRAVQLIKGVTVLFIASWASELLNLSAVRFLLDKAQVALVVALPIVFQPELRRALEQLGRGGFIVRTPQLGEEELVRVIADVVRAVGVLSKNKTGALIVLERESGLKEVAETGTAIDGRVSAELLINIFMPHTPLEDGAVLIRGNRVIAAGCFLPLSENPDLSRDLGARHRAAIGLTEESDALVVVVSEETGAISLANAGKLIRHLDQETLNEMLSAMTNRPVTGLPWLRGTES
ncbi:MAG: diadenylate cyclase CdaA [Bacillota bacterium]|nr:diadenylate cyclase CdaA [Bacillota bacterium]